MVRLVHVTTTDISLELLLGPQLDYYAAQGYEVIGASAPGPFVEGLEARGIRHHPLKHATRSMAPHRDIAAMTELYKCFRALRPDIVHTHNPKPGVYGRFAARAARVPIVVNTVHGLYALPSDPWSKRAVVYSLERTAAMCSDAELVQNPEDVATLRRIGIPKSKIQLLGNGIDLERFNPRAVSPEARASARAELGVGPDDIVCGLVGRLVWEKGYREVFAAAAKLKTHSPRIHFVVIGGFDIEKGDQITELDTAEAQRHADIQFLGMKDDVEHWYSAMDIYVLASHREGFPRSAMEASAMGLPVIATDIRGCREIVDEGKNGLLVPVSDHVALAGAISRLAADAALREAMSRSALEKAHAHFNQQSVIDTTLSTYSRLLTQHGIAVQA
ncbi:MAG: glycosyltransferase family 1 protein [Acidimicrobiia bacterium]|nr:glycosyltransferase family 1 protein [Acidimicrobiia bacterium]